MTDFLKEVIKTTGNEYASLVSDGVEAGDVDTFIDTGSYAFNALLSGSYMVVYLPIKLQQLLVKVQLVKHFFLWECVNIFLISIQMVVSYILNQKVQLQNKWLLIEV